MKIGVLSLVSDVHDPETINRTSQSILSGLQHSFEIEAIDIENIEVADVPVVFVKTGGTEHKFKQIAPILRESGKPVTILSTGSNNSLPASLEILSWLNMNGFKNTLLLHGSAAEIKIKLEKRLRDIQIINTLKRTKIGVVGKPSDWLIAADVDHLSVFERWGVTVVDIELKPVIDNIARFSESAALEILSSFPEARFKKDVKRRTIVNSVKIYLGLKRTIAEYGLSALTLRCFDLLEAFDNTGCMALARLNDEGIPAGCEGDVPTLFTMLINKLITGTPAFMANPSRIENDRITLAHCTVPMSIVESFGLRSHFESGRGVGIAGTFRKEAVTVSRIGGQCLDRFYVAEGKIIDAPESEELCRTQMTIKMEEGVDYFLTSPLGNHHVVTFGSRSKRFKEVMSLFDIAPAAKSRG